MLLSSEAAAELGFAYLHGKGCKKDKQKAAHYYRLAAAQGYDTFGQQWIHRAKYGGALARARSPVTGTLLCAGTEE